MKTKDAYTETMIKLTELEAKLDVLLVLFAKIKEEINPRPKLFRNAGTGCLVCGKYDCIAQSNGLPCPSMTPYALAVGNFGDASYSQVWRESINDKQDAEE